MTSSNSFSFLLIHHVIFLIYLFRRRTEQVTNINFFLFFLNSLLCITPKARFSLQGNVSIIIRFAFYPVILKTFIMVQFSQLKILGEAFKER